jgi:hypothetical protein
MRYRDESISTNVTEREEEERGKLGRIKQSTDYKDMLNVGKEMRPEGQDSSQITQCRD